MKFPPIRRISKEKGACHKDMTETVKDYEQLSRDVIYVLLCIVETGVFSHVGISYILCLVSILLIKLTSSALKIVGRKESPLFPIRVHLPGVPPAPG